MDTNFSNDDLAFRDEVRSFFKEEFDHDMANINTLFKWTKHFDSLILF